MKFDDSCTVWLYFLYLRGAKQGPKTAEKQGLEKCTKKPRKVLLRGSIWEPVGALFGMIFAYQFEAEKRDPLMSLTSRVPGLTGGAQRGYLTKVK